MGGEIFILGLLTGGFVGMAIIAVPDIRDAFAEEFGDVPAVPSDFGEGEAVSERLAGRGSGGNADDLGTHSSGTHTSRPMGAK